MACSDLVLDIKWDSDAVKQQGKQGSSAYEGESKSSTLSHGLNLIRT